MTTYNFRASSWISFVVTLIGSLVCSIILLAILSNYEILPKGNPVMFLLLFGGVILLTIYLTRLAAFAMVEVTLSESSVSVKWLQKFLFDSMPDATIPFIEIAEYVNQSDSNWDWIKIKLKNEVVYRIWHSKLISKDDYRNFISDFVYAVENYNESIEMIVEKKKSAPTSNTIHRAKTFYETTGGLIMGIITAALLIGIPIMFIVFPPKNTSNYGILVFSLIGAIYYVTQIYRSRQRKKDKTNSSTNV